MARFKRKQLFVDRHVQGALVIRSVLYWLFCVITITALLLCWRIMFSGPARVFYLHFDDLWFQYAPVFVASLFLLPIIVIDSVRLSNRFAGPMFRLRRCLRQLAAGDDVAPIHFRERDYWREMADDFNAVAAKLRERADERQPEPAVVETVR